MSSCLMGKVKLLTNLPSLLPFRLSPNGALHSVKTPLCHCTHVWRSLYSTERPHKFCVAINYHQRGRHIWAYYHKASWEDISCTHYSVRSDRERFKMPTAFALTPLSFLSRAADEQIGFLLDIFNNISALTEAVEEEEKNVERAGGRTSSPLLAEMISKTFYPFYIYCLFLKGPMSP